MSDEDLPAQSETWPAPTGPPLTPPDPSIAAIMTAYRQAVRQFQADPDADLRPRDVNDVDPADWQTYEYETGGDVIVTDHLEWGPRFNMTYPQWVVAAEAPQWWDFVTSLPPAQPMQPIGWWLPRLAGHVVASDVDDGSRRGWWSPPNMIAGADATDAAKVVERPFRCDDVAALPAGWVRGDPDSDTGPTVRIAHDPRRHTVVRCAGEISSATSDCLTRAGFEPLLLPGEGATFYVRDRSAQRVAVRPPHQAASKHLGRSL